ncbi:hypothetical protein RRG08_040335 [Elysia crispata]|uniref:Uncharacterized protein n=1 Tax=Elysia crispata TaxID=231223 RepID=A0AAE1ASP9_9GAST|nr:hypothetical protein RRG08_040335 [Elysia crispata]
MYLAGITATWGRLGVTLHKVSAFHQVFETAALVIKPRSRKLPRSHDVGMISPYCRCLLFENVSLGGSATCGKFSGFKKIV